MPSSRSFSISIAILSLAAVRGDLAANEDRLPNIVVIVSDNQGWNDIGYNGSEIQTPNLDRLAAAGTRLTQFYVYPMCSPTRAALIAGRAPSRYGINGAIGHRSRQSLPADTVTLADSLKTCGYETAITGKWHLGLRPESGPLQYGFDSSYGFLHGQIDKFTHRYKNGDRSWHRNDQFIDEQGHSLELITAEAIRLIRQPRQRPLFLYVPYGAPHPPLQEDARWIRPYEPIISEPSRREYAASVTHMDDAVGRLVAALEETDQREHTLIVFLSDNGAIPSWPEQPQNYEGRFGPYPALGNNGPLRGWIGELYDGCLRTPAFLNWPGKIPKGEFNQVTSVLDLYPTLVTLAGGELPEALQLEGRDLWPAVTRAEPLPETVLYWRNYNGHRAAVRHGDWKLIWDRNAKSFELFNMRQDPGEQHDEAALRLLRIQKLLTLLREQASLDGEPAID